MTDDALLRTALTSLEVNDVFSEVVITLRDGSKLLFHHQVGERWAKADGDSGCCAGQVLSTIDLFRLNAKHLDVRFKDGSRWETLFSGSRGTEPRP